MTTKPTTLDECMTALIELLKPEEQMRLLKSSKEDLIWYHHGLGRWIRNNWGLWEGGPLADHMKAMGFQHADDMSNSIIKEFWARMNEKPSEIAADIERYNEHWKKYGTE